MLVGRETELGNLAAKLADARVSRGGVVVVCGEAGIGKTALLREFAKQSEHHAEIRRVSGVSAEQELPFGALYTLLLASQDDRQRVEADPVLASVTGLSLSQTPPSSIAVAASLLRHLSNLGEERPVLVIVDDLQWVDSSSLQALLFAARRVLADRVLVVFGLRTSDASSVVGSVERTDSGAFAQEGVSARVDLHGLETMGLQRLNDADSARVLLERGVSRSDALSLVRNGHGLPLALVELAAMKYHSTKSVHVMNVPAAHSARIDALSTEVRRFCLAVSLDNDQALLQQVFGETFSTANQHAQASGILAVLDGQLKFSHPLLRAALVKSSSQEEIRELHRLIAVELNSAEQVYSDRLDRIALHQAAAVLGPDQRAAEALAEYAMRAYHRGAKHEAAGHFRRAAGMTLDRRCYAEWMLEAAYITFNLGDAKAGLAAAEDLQRTHSDIALSPRLDLLIADSSQWDRMPETTLELFRGEVEKTRQCDPARASWLLAHCAGVSFLDGNLRQGIADAEESILLADSSGEFLSGMLARGYLLWNLFLTADQTREDENAGMLEVMNLMAQEETEEGVNIGQFLAIMAVMQERFDEADAMLTQLTAVARRLGALLSVVLFTMLHGVMSFRLGRWQEAYIFATDDLCEEDLPAVSYAWGCAAAATITAGRGDEALTLAHASRSLDVSRALRIPMVQGWALTAIGQLHVGYGRYDLALPYFDEVNEIVNKMHLHEPNFLTWQGDFIETLVESDRRGEAEAALEALRQQNESVNRGWARGIIARSEALLSLDGDQAEQHFEQALKEFQAASAPFETARTFFLRGTKRNSIGKKKAADDFAEASRIFRRLGALSWLQRTERVANVAAKFDDDVDIASLLSPSELRVAVAASSGRTNRQAAEELYLSVKTVEYHLQSVYRKLNVRNRVEFAAMFHRHFAPPKANSAKSMN